MKVIVDSESFSALLDEAQLGGVSPIQYPIINTLDEPEKDSFEKGMVAGLDMAKRIFLAEIELGNFFDCSTFDKQIDEDREKLRTLALNKGGEARDICRDISNRLEISRRIFNHFICTGKAKIPE